MSDNRREVKATLLKMDDGSISVSFNMNKDDAEWMADRVFIGIQNTQVVVGPRGEVGPRGLVGPQGEVGQRGHVGPRGRCGACFNFVEKCKCGIPGISTKSARK